MTHGQDDSFPSRRGFFAATALAGAAAALPTGAARAAAPGLDIPRDGTYPVKPLSKEAITLGVAQSRVIPVDETNIVKSRKANLDHMVGLIDAAQRWGGKKDILFFHEFPITGYKSVWTRKDVLKIAIELPGEETEIIQKRAKDHGCYIVFGTYARDRAWPDHTLSITVIVGPDGSIVDKHWKARNIKGVFEGLELFTTTIYDVYDRYVEMYGLDAVVPVTRTEIGNIATSSIQREPEYFRAQAIKGAEILLRTATGGFIETDIAATSLYNGIYTAVCNNAVSPQEGSFFEDEGAGGSAIYGPDGRQIAKANSVMENLVTARIPIGDFRKRHRQPILHDALYRDVYGAYAAPYATGLFQSYLPSDGLDAKRFLADKSRWK